MLTEMQVRKAKPQAKAVKLTDGKGLYLLITPAGGKLWRYNYRFDNKRKTLAIGKYPDIGIADARTKHGEARALIAQGIDPSSDKKAH
ncbi:MAG: integrase, partial [Desulfobacteraceae bacterium 4572_35.2]